MSLRRIRLAKRSKSFKRLRLIPRFCNFGISSTFDAVFRYLPIFFAVLRYLSIFSAVLRCSAPPNVPLGNHRDHSEQNAKKFFVDIEVGKFSQSDCSILLIGQQRYH